MLHSTSVHASFAQHSLFIALFSQYVNLYLPSFTRMYFTITAYSVSHSFGHKVSYSQPHYLSSTLSLCLQTNCRPIMLTQFTNYTHLFSSLSLNFHSAVIRMPVLGGVAVVKPLRSVMFISGVSNFACRPGYNQ